MRRSWRLLLVVLLPVTAWAQGNPLGPEFRVNTYTTGTQNFSAVASDGAGNFVVVWMSDYQDGSNDGIFGQRYGDSGAPLGPEFRVNAYTTGKQAFPSVAADPGGNFIVVWESFGQVGALNGIFGQRYASSGVPLGPEFRVNTFTTSYNVTPVVASDSSGNFVVVWVSEQDGGYTGIFGQRYAGTGLPLGAEFRINTWTTSRQQAPAVAADASGNFVVVWNSAYQDGSNDGVFGQRYASSGVPAGPEFRVNSYTTSFQGDPALAVDSLGNFIVAWPSLGQDGSLDGICGQRYASSGAPLGTEFRVNTFTTGVQRFASVNADASGDFVVVWSSNDQDGSSFGAFGQRFLSGGVPVGPEFRVNTYTPTDQYDSAIGLDASGSFVVVWTSRGQEGSNYAVYGQRYRPIVPVGLMHFGIE